MMKLKSAVFDDDPKQVEYVFTDRQLQEIAEITDLKPGVFNLQHVDSGELADVEVLFATWSFPHITDEHVKKMPKLKAVFYAAGATDYFARPLLNAGVALVSAWQMNAIPVAEFTLAQILLALKGYFRNTREVRETRDWARDKSYVGPGVYGETVALLGAGAIANHVVELLKPHSVNVVVMPSRKERRTVSMEELFRTAFVVSNHLPNRDDNQKVIRREHFESMRPGAVFINTGRGQQVDEEAMLDVLEKRPDLTALLDVTWPEPPSRDSRMYSLPNVFVTTHIAGSVNDEVHRMADCAIAECRRYLAGEPLLYQVNESMLITSQTPKK